MIRGFSKLVKNQVTENNYLALFFIPSLKHGYGPEPGDTDDAMMVKIKPCKRGLQPEFI